MEIPFHGRHTRDTIIQACTLAGRPSTRYAVKRAALVLLVAGIYTAYAVTVAQKERLTGFETAWLVRHAVALPFLLFYLFQPFFASYFAALKLWKDPSAGLPVSGVVTDQGIRYDRPGSPPLQVDWDRFIKKRLADDMIALLTVDGKVSSLPRRFFDNDQDWQHAKRMADFRVVEPR